MATIAATRAKRMIQTGVLAAGLGAGAASVTYASTGTSAAGSGAVTSAATASSGGPPTTQPPTNATTQPPTTQPPTNAATKTPPAGQRCPEDGSSAGSPRSTAG
ncbi:MAG: hypothetical protein ACYCO9_04675 [Streptosporangiaceae bacterium]